MAISQTPIDSPLSAEQKRQLAEGARGVRVVDGAVRLATFNGWSLAVVAVLSAPLALFDFTTLLVAAALGGLAFNEFRGRARVRRMDPGGLRGLGWNQIVLIGLVGVYCLWSIYAGLTGPKPFAKEIAAEPELGQMLAPLQNLQGPVTIVMYALVFVLVAGFQGYCARYYFSRERMLREHVAGTAGWVVEVLRLMR